MVVSGILKIHINRIRPLEFLEIRCYILFYLW